MTYAFDSMHLKYIHFKYNLLLSPISMRFEFYVDVRQTSYKIISDTINMKRCIRIIN